MKILTEADFRSSTWSGGTTTQLIISPEGASLEERNFDWRISTAVVKTEVSDFTVFHGYERILIPLKGKLEMEHRTPNGVIRQDVSEFELARFSGEWSTKGKGKITDFNIFFKPVYHPKLHISHFSGETEVVLPETTDMVFLESGSCTAGIRFIHAPALLLIEDSEKVQLACSKDSRIISIELDLVD
ncbi:HutD/Ves family protein [Fluviicola chungangensis]|uniref:HutD family protein n=1 Tax=Fluviicola chungangensis TaxID=2597671 RepID=A0A556MR48_9FLAO|nr:HutD family protein [Fluviicola chungangensis]TSJ42411.1 HutD family protein [Fluviicola chungangensis]